MRSLLAVAVGLVLVGNAEAAPESGPQEELRALEKERSDAIKRGDMRTLDAIYADDFTGIAGSGQVISKAELFEVFKRTDPRVTFTTDEVAVRVFGEVAVVTARLTGKTAEGSVVSDARIAHVYARREGKWKFVFGQATPIRTA